MQYLQSGSMPYNIAGGALGGCQLIAHGCEDELTAAGNMPKTAGPPNSPGDSFCDDPCFDCDGKFAHSELS